LPQLPLRIQLAADPSSPTNRRRCSSSRCRTTRMDHRNPTSPSTDQTTRHTYRRGRNRMTTKQLLNRIERACAELRQNKQPVTFTAVAAKTGTARATLYRNQTLRTVIEEQRRQAAASGTLTSLTDEIATLRATVETLAARVRQHEKQLRGLRNN